MSDFYVMRKGHDEFNLSDKLTSVHFLELNVGAPQLTPTYNSIQGSDGQLLQTVSFNSSTAVASFFIKAGNRSEFNLAKSALQRELYARVPIRIRSSDDPGKAVWVLANPTDINPLANSDDAKIDLAFTIISGTKLTPFNSDELADNQDKLSFGMNLDLDNLPSYHFNSNNFNVFNPSDLDIDPYIQHHQLTWTIKGTGQNVTLTNNTNGTSFTANAGLGNSDNIDHERHYTR
ncbi:phage tail domain-containing protein [Fructobacillus cardui]|uniref:Siphovirus-type tail component RIFT-related domain-containing protein n=1 Tax=Fructobacillus cardui TaxID=2893170 RepID=A0ABM9MS40_9LACO|nr:hypothetical protein R82641_BJNNKPBH_00512 [Fructobacillus cardui]